MLTSTMPSWLVSRSHVNIVPVASNVMSEQGAPRRPIAVARAVARSRLTRELRWLGDESDVMA